MRSRWTLVVLTLIVSIVLAACGTGAPVATQEAVSAPTDTPTEAAAATEAVGPAPASIMIGATIPLTGAFGTGGAQIKAGYELAIADINAQGGVMVKAYNAKIPLEMKVLDDGSNTDTAVTNMQTLSTEDHVVAYLGGYGSGMHAATAPVADENKIPYLGVAFSLYSVHQQGYTYLFSPFPKSPTIAKAVFDLLDTLPADQKPRNVAILAENTGWGSELSGLWTSEAGKRGYQIVATEQYDPGAVDYAASIQKIKEANAQVLLALPTPPDGIAIYKEMEKQNYAPPFSLFLRATDSPAWVTDLGSVGDYAAMAPGWHNAMKYPGVDQLNQEYQAKMGRPTDPVAGPAYACVQLLADAIERAGSLDHEAIRKAFSTTDLETVVGPVTFNTDGTGNVQAPILQYQKGVAQLVWPKEFATADLVYPAPAYDQR